MKPFSALYFVKENKVKCILLMFMIFLGYATYLGGLYVSNVVDNWKIVFEYENQMLCVSPGETEENKQEYLRFLERVYQENKVELLLVSGTNSFTWKCIMGFEQGRFAITFRSVSDFRTYCEYMGIDCEFDRLGQGSMIMSDRFAKNRGLEIGDSVDGNYERNIYDEYTLDALTLEDGYTLYFIDEKTAQNGYALILGNGDDKEELREYVRGIFNNYDEAGNQEITYQEMIDNQLSIFYGIYVFILVLTAVILAVTIQAAFVGMYQKRVFEFAVYRAIGISKLRVVKKIAAELLCMDLISILAGAGIFFPALYLFNHGILYPKGMYLRYYHPLALFGLALCNVIVVVPLIFTRCKKMLRADICEY